MKARIGKTGSGRIQIIIEDGRSEDGETVGINLSSGYAGSGWNDLDECTFSKGELSKEEVEEFFKAMLAVLEEKI